MSTILAKRFCENCFYRGDESEFLAAADFSEAEFRRADDLKQARFDRDPLYRGTRRTEDAGPLRSPSGQYFLTAGLLLMAALLLAYALKVK